MNVFSICAPNRKLTVDRASKSILNICKHLIHCKMQLFTFMVTVINYR